MHSLQVLSGTAALVFCYENARFGKWFSQYFDNNADCNVNSTTGAKHQSGCTFDSLWSKILTAPLNK
jgi:hypothetical protein